MTFSGEHKHTVDEKGRMIMPQRFREVLGTNVMITKGLEKCLLVYTMEKWKTVSEELVEKLSYSEDEHREFLRFFLGSAVNCEIDKQGRCLIPPMLRDYSKIGGEVVTVGMLDKIEIWDANAYAKWHKPYEPTEEKTDEESKIKEITRSIGPIKI